jgi:hypothetical protein
VTFQRCSNDIHQGSLECNVGSVTKGNIRSGILNIMLPSGKHTKSYGKSPFSMGKLTISMAIFNSFLYVYQKVSISFDHY